MALKAIPETPQLPSPKAGSVSEIRAWMATMGLALFRALKDLAYRTNRVLPKDGSERMLNPLPLATFTVATRPAASSWTGAIIYVSDGGAGAVFQGSNGSAWVNLG